jgi:hypothetical protein
MKDRGSWFQFSIQARMSASMACTLYLLLSFPIAQQGWKRFADGP